MDLQHNTKQIPVIRHPKPETLGCAIIDAAGREVPITEEMIQHACRELEQRLVKPAQQD
ncbi:PA1571 family protein [Pseudomonas asplenii]|uniref:Multifunctional fatty acid oxidation complex subunit alpha n=1 Tax=Pseudomonas asplenii TaxID=53407 RepID=A0A1H6NJD4_9PSED|nr:PA1571 family protein [Pseudomonas fuscovaginae]SEI15576.1 hypothetical protein SAMN05216581_2989 [Pseudomonas fuscovaginae]